MIVRLQKNLIGEVRWRSRPTGVRRITPKRMKPMTARISRRNSCAAILNTATNMLKPLTLRHSRRVVWPGTGGWSFAADPDLPAHHLPIVWHPSTAASVIVLRPAPFPCDGCSQAEIVGDMDIAAEHRDDEGWHLVLSTAKRRYRLNICGETTETEPLAYVLPGDAFWETRQAAVSDFHEHCISDM